MIKPSALLVALVAGVTSALLFAGLVVESATAIGLALVAPMPIVIASLGWGSVAGFAAAALAGLTIAALFGDAASGLSIIATIALPAAVAGHFCGLARPAAAQPANDTPSPRLDWYPLPGILFAVIASVTLGCLFYGWLADFDPAALNDALSDALRQQAGMQAELTDAQLQQLSQLVVRLVPFAQPALLVLVHVVNLYVGAAVTRASGRLPRPKDDVPASAGLPWIAIVLLAVAALLCLEGGLVGAVAAAVAGALTAGFTLVGLAAMHRRTRGRAGRGLVLFAAYAAILLLTFPILVFTVIGIMETAGVRRAGKRH
ncbi:hypothetical protein NPA31_004110 [Aurantimonas sp. MSK8Z-1]|uniref:hypothetical protein n=1 Tax=Mangrovibrevibacter kandeliae TaxID=2968473 RepID=UPI002118F365|nr:hypothetical protein [Aurantimonas sp. MSK8Z-1]MCW4114148.1 hypothetical protein [Aurantimonas sp. MSK8Z-1]